MTWKWWLDIIFVLSVLYLLLYAFVANKNYLEKRNFD